jgi:uncharacterized protein (DUF2345 family)
LTEQAKTHKADLPKQKEADKLAVAAGLQRTADTLSARAADGAPAFDAPLLQVDSPSGIVAATPADALLASETASSMTASQDINFAAQANLLHSSVGGISLFTYGKATAKEKPNQETGLHLHAASGKYSSQSQEAETKLTSDKAVTVASINAEVNIAAKQHVLLTTQGAAIRIEGGNITLNAPGKVEFKASIKELGGAKDGSVGLPNLPKLAVTNYPEKYSNRLDVYDLFVQHELTAVTYAAKRADGKVVRGVLDQHGRTDQLYVKDKEEIEVLVGPKQTEWSLIYDYDDE